MMLRNRALFLSILAACCLFLAGCSGASAPKPMPPAAALVEEAAPLGLNVLEEVNDGTNLNLNLELSANTRVDLKDVVVRLAALKNGEEQSISLFPASRLGEEASPEAPLRFSVSVPSAGMTDYQLELLWGQDGRDAMKAKGPPDNGGQLVLSDVSLIDDQCAAPCDSKFTVGGVLENQSGRVVQIAELGVAFAWVGSGETLDPDSAEIQQKISLKGLALRPGQRQEIKVKLSKGLPKATDGRYMPVVKLINFEFAPEG